MAITALITEAITQRAAATTATITSTVTVEAEVSVEVEGFMVVVDSTVAAGADMAAEAIANSGSSGLFFQMHVVGDGLVAGCGSRIGLVDFGQQR